MKPYIPILTLFLWNTACEQQAPPNPIPPVTSQFQPPTADVKTSDTGLLENDSQSFNDRVDKFLQLPPEDDSSILIGKFTTPKPPTWFWVPPKSQIVKINYVVPSVDTSDPALFSATQFAEGEGGHFTENIVRWKSMFRTNDGAPVKPNLQVITVNGHDAVVAEFHGEYMGAGAAWHLKDHVLLVAEVREPEGNYYFKILGPAATVRAHKQSFLNVITELYSAP